MVTVATDIFSQSSSQIKNLNSKILLVTKEIEELVSKLNAIKSKIISKSSDHLKNRMKRLEQRQRLLVKQRISKSDSSDKKEIKLRYNDRIEFLQNLIDQLKKQIFSRMLEQCDEETILSYNTLMSNLALQRQEKATIPKAIFNIRQQTYDIIKQSWEKNGYKEAFSDINMPVDKVYRYLDRYLETFLELQNPLQVLSHSLPQLLSIIDNFLHHNTNQSFREILCCAFISLLSFRTESKDDIVSYFHGLSAIAPELINNSLFEQFCFESLSLTKFELESVSFFASSRLESLFPPIASTRYVIQNYKDETIRYPDCGETVLRNIVNIFLYDKNTQTYDFKILLEAKLEVPNELVSFYKTHPKVADTSSQMVHNDWSAMLVKLSSKASADLSLHFLEPRVGPVCEMKPGVENLVRAIRLLFGSNDIHYIFERLNSQRKEMIVIDSSDFHFVELEKLCNENILVFSIGDTKVEILCNHRHYRAYERSNHTTQRSQLVKSLDSYVNKFGLTRAICLTGVELKRLPIIELIENDFLTSLKDIDLIRFMLSTRTDWVNDTIDLSYAGLKYKELLLSPATQSILANVICAIPSINGYHEVREQIADYITLNDIVEFTYLVPVLRTFQK